MVACSHKVVLQIKDNPLTLDLDIPLSPSLSARLSKCFWHKTNSWVCSETPFELNMSALGRDLSAITPIFHSCEATENVRL